ncbi:MAG: APC family permease [Frankiaceae bacterium]|nr:APC family permease [Frankiaceae bacterium]MBV9870583.1 APC family permease [Frankiaceae bacterium]
MTAVAEPQAGTSKGLKGGALGLWSTVVVAVASTAPAYSLAATLGFIVLFVGVQTPVVVILAFIPMWMISVGYSELNKQDPDCGTTFTWATRMFGPRVGWYLGGWGIIASDVLIMASLAQIAGQYVFLLFGADGIGSNPASGWVLLVGLGWLAIMTYICYRGIEVSANMQKGLLAIEAGMLVVFSVVALVKVGTGNAPKTHISPSWSWFNPFNIPSMSAFVAGLILMIFIYWGWDTAVTVNEETKDPQKTPGRAAIISTVLLLALYAVATLAAQSFAGVGDKGIGLANDKNASDVINVLARAVFGHSTVGTVFVKLLILMVLSSAAASTQTTILPTARTTLAMAVYRALPTKFAKIHKRYLTPSFSTVAMGVVAAILYVVMNYQSGGLVISDSVTSCGVFIAMYYGTTGFACAWWYRKSLTKNLRDFFMQGVFPVLGGLILFVVLGWSYYLDWLDPNAYDKHPTEASYTSWKIPGIHWVVGGVAVIVTIALLIGLVAMIVYNAARPAFFRGEVLNRSTPTLVPEATGMPAGVPPNITRDDVPPDAPLVPPPSG